MALRVGVDLQIFHILAKKEGESMSAAELAAETKAEELLISMCWSP